MDYPITVTLKALRQAGACVSGYNKVVRAIQGRAFDKEDERRESYIRHRHEEPIQLADIVESNGLDDALWALRAVPVVDRDARLFAVWCARQVQHLMTDERSIAALDVAERFANLQATEQERAAARVAAWAAAGDAEWDAAWDAAGDAAGDAARDAARDAAWAAAWAAARDAARDAAWAAARVAARDAAWVAARDAARDAARAAARVAEWDAQRSMFVKMCNGQAPWQTQEK